MGKRMEEGKTRAGAGVKDAAPISMVRDEPDHAGGPTRADVHPDEAEAWRAAGWRVAGPAAPEG